MNNIDLDIYAYGYCSYASLAFGSLYPNTKYVLWLDIDVLAEKENTMVLCHAYNKITEGLFIDVNGIFSDNTILEDYYEFNEVHLYTRDSADEVKRMFRSLHAGYGDSKLKSWILNFFKTNAPTFIVNINGNSLRLAFMGVIKKKNKDFIVTKVVTQDTNGEVKLSDKQVVEASELVKSINYCANEFFKWIPIKDWYKNIINMK